MNESSRSHTVIPAVLIVQRVVIPYRVAFYQDLAQSEKLELTVATGVSRLLDGIDSLSEVEGVDIRPLRNYSVGSDVKALWQSGLLSKIISRRFDIVIAEFNIRIISNVIACLLSKAMRRRFAWWGHGITADSSALTIRIRRWLISISDGIVTYDDVSARRLVDSGVPSNKVFVAMNSIDTDGIAEITKKARNLPRNRILCIGRLIATKKVDLLIKAFASARENLPGDTTLTVVGNGPERAELGLLVSRLGVESSVEFTGTIYDEDRLGPYFLSSWICVSPGYVGLSAIHSLAYGLPMLVARDEPHSPEISALEDGVNSVYFDSDEPDELARVLVELSGRPQYMEKLSFAAIKTVQDRYSVQAMTRTFEEIVTGVPGS